MTTLCHTCRHFEEPRKGAPLCSHPSQLNLVTGQPTSAFRARASADQCGPDARLYERSANVYVMSEGFDLAIKWQPIATAPKDGTDVLLFYPTYKRQVWLGHYRVSETFTNGKLDYRNEGWINSLLMGLGKEPEPTHWMPVPEGPDAAPDAALVCEGFATGARLAEATGVPVEVAFDTDWSKNKRLTLTEDSPALLEAVCTIVSNAFAPGSGITAGPTIDERKALAEAGVTCLLEQAARVLTRQAPSAPDQAEA